MKQQSIFDIAAAIAAREASIAQVDAAASPDWKTAAIGAVAHLARSQDTFTTDDVWKLAPCTTHEPRAMGAVMRHAAGLGMCVATERYEQSERVACHRRPLRVWQSRLRGTP